MSDPPPVVVLDVNETLSDLAALGARFASIGAPAALMATWFAGVLRDGFALTSVGEAIPFGVLARDGLRDVLGGLPLAVGEEAAVEQIMSEFADLDLHPDVEPGLRALHEVGLRVVTLSNGAAEVAERLLTRAGVRDLVEQVLTVEDAGVWKPARAAYRHAAERCGVDAADMLMVAVHPWDLHGAAKAGLRTAWINRRGRAYPSAFRRPDHQAPGLDALADSLIRP